jgi:hypothetical protein
LRAGGLILVVRHGATAGASGFIIERTGFQDFFIGTSLIGIPVALLALFVWRNHPTERNSCTPLVV